MDAILHPSQCVTSIVHAAIGASGLPGGNEGTNGRAVLWDLQADGVVYQVDVRCVHYIWLHDRIDVPAIRVTILAQPFRNKSLNKSDDPIDESRNQTLGLGSGRATNEPASVRRYHHFFRSVANRRVHPVMTFRSPIVTMVQCLASQLPRRIKVGPVEIELAETLDQVEAELVVEKSNNESLGATAAPQDLAVANALPVAAVIQANSRVEKAMYNALDVIGKPMPPGRYRPNEALKRVVEARLLSDNLAKAVAQLRTVRNELAHSPDPAITSVQAAQYVLLADDLVETLRRASGSDAMHP